jgi:hypothetical protein
MDNSILQRTERIEWRGGYLTRSPLKEREEPFDPEVACPLKEGEEPKVTLSADQSGGTNENEINLMCLSTRFNHVIKLEYKPDI